MMHRMAGCAMLSVLAVLLPVSGVRAELKVGDRPVLDLKTMDNVRVTSKDLGGRLVIVEFWATWCGPCVKMVPHLRELNAKYRERGVVMISISRDKDISAAQQFIKDNEMSWVQVHDMSQPQQLGPAWGVRGIPHAFIISPEGEMLWRGHPASMDKPLEGFLASHPPRAGREQGHGHGQKSDDDTRDRDAALKAISEATAALRSPKPDFEKLLSLIESVPEDVLEDQRVRANARTFGARLRLMKVHEKALAEAREANPEAAEKLDQLLAAAIAPPGVEKSTAVEEEPGDPGPKAGKVHPQILATKLKKAHGARESGQHATAYKTYQWIVDRAAQSDEASIAATHLKAYQDDKQLMPLIQKELDEQEAESLLALARNYEAAGQSEEARATYERIVAEHPQSDCCGEARKALSRQGT